MIEDDDDGEKKRGFSSWKLTVLDAMSFAPELTDLDFRVAFRIMQHVNGRTRLAWPSVARLAAQLGKSEDRIRASTKRLTEAGWLIKQRYSQKAPNEYSFLDKKVDETVSRMLDRLDAIAADDHAKMHGQRSDDHADLRGGDHAELPCPDHANLHGKHLHLELPSKNTFIEGSEHNKVSAYARAKGKAA